MVWGPKLQAILRNKGSANWLKMEQFDFLTISYSNSNLKGGQFNEKNSHHNYLGPDIAGHYEK